MIFVSLLLAMQAAPAQPRVDTTPTPWPDTERQLRTEGALRNATDPAARMELGKWAGCIARKNPGETARVLRMDFTTGSYNRAIRMLSESDKSCVTFRGTLRSAGLLFAGELAEAMLESGSSPLAGRLARAAGMPSAQTYSFTDKVAMCVVRSVPDDVSALFATERGSAEETAKLEALATPMGMCAKAAEAHKPISVNPAGLRAMLATASYRSVASLEAA